MTSIKRFEGGRRVAVASALALVAFAACTEKSPSGPDDSQLPAEPVTVTLQIDWDDFASNLQVYGGYGTPDDLSTTLVARGFGGMEARTLLRFAPYRITAQVRDSVGNLRTDTALTIIDAYVVALFDSVATVAPGLVTLQLGQMQEDWHSPSANWGNSLDTVGAVEPWAAPGGGNVIPIRSTDYDPSFSDSAQFFLDPTQVANWRGAADSIRSVRIDALTDGTRLELGGAAVRLVATSLLDPDTVIVLTVPTTASTFIYDPPATPPTDGVRVGGSPAWRTTLNVTLPSTLTGPPELCAAVGCPFTLAPANVTYAGLGLRSRRPPDAFQPADSVRLDVRSVLSPAALPKSPLGGSLVNAGGAVVRPEVFGVDEGSLVDVPITAFVQTFLAGPDASGRMPSSTLALLATPEPGSFAFAEFFGPGGANAPVLKLILTVSPPMELP